VRAVAYLHAAGSFVVVTARLLNKELAVSSNAVDLLERVVQLVPRLALTRPAAVPCRGRGEKRD
jgi:hypothetical protein